MWDDALDGDVVVQLFIAIPPKAQGVHPNVRLPVQCNGTAVVVIRGMRIKGASLAKPTTVCSRLLANTLSSRAAW